MADRTPTIREFAALAYALARARGLLTSVEMGRYNRKEVSQTLKGTSSANIAAALGLKDELGIDWSEYLSEVEMDKIAGRR
jgi:hypothetical protein